MTVLGSNWAFGSHGNAVAWKLMCESVPSPLNIKHTHTYTHTTHNTEKSISINLSSKASSLQPKRLLWAGVCIKPNYWVSPRMTTIVCEGENSPSIHF